MNRFGILLLVPALAALSACPADPCADALCLVSEGLPEALLSVRAPAADDVWVCGSDGGGGPTLAGWDGAQWSFVDTSALAGQELWWVHPTAETIFAVGSGGLILEVERSNSAVTVVPGPDPDVTFFGVWGASGGDVWAVGGAPGGTLTPRIWRRGSDGTWARYIDATLGEGDPGQLYFKVHGATASDLWIVGSGGLALHWDGTGLVSFPTDTDVDTSNAQLLSIDLDGDAPLAGGGSGSALLLAWDGSAWHDASPEFQPAINGVCARGAQGYAVGAQGSLAEQEGGAWSPSLDSLTLLDYHSCAVDPSGGLWAVGGRIASRPLEQGVLVYQGAGEIPPLR